MDDVEKRIKKERRIFFIVVPVILLIALVGISFAFFNYTRTGTGNTIRVGRISFVTRQTETINLTNVFPIDRANVDTDTDNVDEVVIEIEGDTDYTDGIEYLVSSSDANISITRGNKTIDVPVSLDIDIDDLGNENNNYFTARDNANESIYKKLVGDELVGEEMLLVGYIVPNTTSGTAEGIDGSITIKAFFDKEKIGISDTYDGTESDNNGTTNGWASGRTILTTTEWNALQTNGVSFKIKVEANEGIWVIGSLEEIMRKSAVMDNINSTYVNNTTPGIDFTNMSSDTNGRGVYISAGTANDENPIIYYRGAITDNNVMFANKCWKAVRTTETGGVKLIYNGEPTDVYSPGESLEQSEYINVSTPKNAFTFDETDNTWNTTIVENGGADISYTVPNGNYTFTLSGTTAGSSGGTVNLYKNGSRLTGNSGGGGSAIAISYSLGTISSTDTIKIQYTGSGSVAGPVTLKFKLEENSIALSKNSYTMSGISFTFDETDKKWISHVQQYDDTSIMFKVNENGNYVLDLFNPNKGTVYLRKNGESISIIPGANRIILKNITTTDKISFEYQQMMPNDASLELKLYKGVDAGLGCDNDKEASQITLNVNNVNTNTFKFNNLNNSLNYNGYMYGSNMYENLLNHVNHSDVPTYKFGTGFTYNNGTYTLTNMNNELDNTRHYTCFNTTGTCTEYIYFVNDAISFPSYYRYYYIMLSDGKIIDDAIIDSQKNEVNSNVKSIIDTWYTSNMISYTNKIEDTIWCNDRSISYYGGLDPSGIIGDETEYGATGRLYGTKQLSLNCINKNDAFTVYNGNGNSKLIYPVALLTADEITLAGGQVGKNSSTMYLNSHKEWWSMSPYFFAPSNFAFSFGSSGFLGGNYVTNDYGVRPAISIKHGQLITKGNGSVVEPYVIE